LSFWLNCSFRCYLLARNKSHNGEEVTVSKDDETDDADTLSGGPELMSDDNLSRVEQGMFRSVMSFHLDIVANND
jgi:hypothetical protein